MERQSSPCSLEKLLDGNPIEKKYFTYPFAQFRDRNVLSLPRFLGNTLELFPLIKGCQENLEIFQHLVHTSQLLRVIKGCRMCNMEYNFKTSRHRRPRATNNKDVETKRDEHDHPGTIKKSRRIGKYPSDAAAAKQNKENSTSKLVNFDESTVFDINLITARAQRRKSRRQIVSEQSFPNCPGGLPLFSLVPPSHRPSVLSPIRGGPPHPRQETPHHRRRTNHKQAPKRLNALRTAAGDVRSIMNASSSLFARTAQLVPGDRNDGPFSGIDAMEQLL
uniref:Uncharacterized protein n=1 Tax=Steinernema glaseri TaxID=37863 RepID=A0A1I7YUN8_9BILA